jgi:uncharacterized protein (DUF697 family)
MLKNIDIPVIQRSLSTIDKGVNKYVDIMNCLQNCDVSKDTDFQTLYKGFYRVRRNNEFCKAYFEYMEEHKNSVITFENVLQYLYDTNKKIEPSFASKLLATINPNMPVWDKNVLSQLSIKAPQLYCKNRFEAVVETYAILENWYMNYLNTDNAKDVIDVFNSVYPNVQTTDIKKIDLALWSLGVKKLKTETIETQKEIEIEDIDTETEIPKKLKKRIPKEYLVKCHAVIHSAALAAGAFGAIPIPIADAIPISAAQITMILSLGKVYDLAVDKHTAEALIGVGLAVKGGRFIVSNIFKAIPGINLTVGAVIGASTAVAITQALGWLVADNFYRISIGEKPDTAFEKYAGLINNFATEFNNAVK